MILYLLFCDHKVQQKHTRLFVRKKRVTTNRDIWTFFTAKSLLENLCLSGEDKNKSNIAIRPRLHLFAFYKLVDLNAFDKVKAPKRVYHPLPAIIHLLNSKIIIYINIIILDLSTVVSASPWRR